jgi:transposase
MIFVGIDVAKDKHDCFILNSEGTVLADLPLPITASVLRRFFQESKAVPKVKAK